jgi:hypothetical protein
MPKKQKNNKRKSRGGGGLPTPTSEYQAKTPENFSALKLVKSLKGPNDKYINTVYNALNGAPTPSSPYIACLNAVAQGTGENSRVGRLIRNKWIDFDIELAIGPNTSMLDASLRVYIVVESTALGSQIAPGQFFADASAFTPTSQRDRTNRNASRFVVLWDSGPLAIGNPRYTNGTTTLMCVGGGQPSARPMSKHLPLNFSTDYSRGNAGTYADIDTNSLWIMVVSDDTSGNCNITGGYTTCFQDDS